MYSDRSQSNLLEAVVVSLRLLHLSVSVRSSSWRRADPCHDNRAPFSHTSLASSVLLNACSHAAWLALFAKLQEDV